MNLKHAAMESTPAAHGTSLPNRLPPSEEKRQRILAAGDIDFKNNVEAARGRTGKILAVGRTFLALGTILEKNGYEREPELSRMAEKWRNFIEDLYRPSKPEGSPWVMEPALFFSRIWIFWFHFVVAGMLLWTFREDNSDSFFQILRWVVSSYCAYLAYTLHGLGEKKIVWALGLAVLIYNPIFPTHFEREVWLVVNVMTLVPLAMSIPPVWKTLD